MTTPTRLLAAALLALLALLPAACGSSGGAASDATTSDADASTAPVTPPESLGGGFIEAGAALHALSPPLLTLFPGDDAEIPHPTLGLIGDLDEDGRPEVILATSYLADDGPTGRVLAYDPATRQLTPRDDLPLPSGMPVALLDLDGDGHLDLVSAGGEVPRRPYRFGRGDGSFEPGQEVDPEGPAGFLYAQSIALHPMDIDQDGLLDLVYGNDKGLVPVLNLGNRRLAIRDDLLSGGDSAGTCAVLGVELLDGQPVLMAFGGPRGNVGHVAFGLERLDDQGFPRFVPATPFPSVGWVADWYGLPMADDMALMAPMAGAVGDLDGDGGWDLLIALDPIHAVLGSTGALPLVDRTGDAGFGAIEAPSGVPMISWGTAAVDLDRDGRPDLVIAHGDDAGTFLGSGGRVIGPQHVTAHYNGGDYRFADITERLGLGRLGQYLALTVGDLDGDGDPDLIVGAQGTLPVIYDNAIETPNRGFGLILRGTTSNPAGVGARVTIPAEGARPEQHHYIGAIASPLAVSQPMAFVGLGEHDRAALTRITWPSGLVQEVRDLAAGTVHTVVEPELIGLSPAARHQPADGQATVVVRVTPRRADGSIASLGPGAVQIGARFGHDGFEGQVQAVDGGFERTLRAPTAPGSTVVEVTIEGTPVRVRPRIWWGAP